MLSAHYSSVTVYTTGNAPVQLHQLRPNTLYYEGACQSPTKGYFIFICQPQVMSWNPDKTQMKTIPPKGIYSL